MSDDDTQKYVDQIKQGWGQLSAGVADQVKKYTTGETTDEHNIIPSSLMSTESGDSTDKQNSGGSSSDTETQGYVEQIKQGWRQLSGGVSKQNMSSPSASSAGEVDDNQGHARVSSDKSDDDAKALADDPLGLNVQGDDVRKPKGVRITPANREYAEMATKVGKMHTGGAEQTGDDPLGLGGK